MSWGTCYKGSNNVHFNFPPLMDDGRNFSNYETSPSFDNKLKEKANITTNSDYRAYLQSNADSIIKNNQLNACDDCAYCPYASTNTNTNTNANTATPYIFNSTLSNDQPHGYETSDLKNIYLSRQQLESKMYAPRIEVTE